jgi:hypothetical protein
MVDASLSKVVFSGVTLYSNRGLAVISFQYCPRFNCKVIAPEIADICSQITDEVRDEVCPRFEYKDALKSAI